MIGAKMKYVVFDGYNGEQIIIFPKKIQHSHFAKSVEELSFGTMRPISGGFVVDGQCVGESESLRMKSRRGKDTALIPKLLDADHVELTEFEVEELFEVSEAPSKNKLKRERRKLKKKKR